MINMTNTAENTICLAAQSAIGMQIMVEVGGCMSPSESEFGPVVFWRSLPRDIRRDRDHSLDGA
ncbi:hypothetical protein [Bradyrhizobium sp. UFLA05-112]